MMNKRFLGVMLAVVLALSTSACGRKSESANAMGGPADAKLMADKRVLDASASTEPLLSYKHELQIQVPTGQLEPGLQALKQTCQAAAEHACIVMKASQIRGLHAEIVMSVRRQAVEGLRLQAVGFGKLVSQSTLAEDMTGPITDVTRRLAMQKALREDLLELRKQSRGNIDALLKTTEKLAEVQASIEAAEGDLVTYRNRVAMDELRVGLDADHPSYQEERHPVQDALKNFVSNLADGLGALIQFLALAAPWLLLIAALPFVWRGLRRIWKLGRR
ncbi:DUF4349 domain-containing protein [Burkholderiaceae bacterium UC74_6]